MDDEKLMETISKELEEIMQKASNDVVATICRRLKTVGEMSATDAIRLANLARVQDLKDITRIIAQTNNMATMAVKNAIGKAAQHNDELAKAFYDSGDGTVNYDLRDAMRRRAEKSISDGILNLSKTTAFFVGGKATPAAEMYTKAVNQAIFAVQSGTSTFNTSMRALVQEMADSGLRVIDYDSGYHRRLDSAARMNLLDGVRQFNMEYRELQGEEFGADGVEISVHALCAPDHIDIQGRQFSKEEFEKLNESLERAIGTCNCYHSTYPIIIGISEPTYTKKELSEYKQASEAKVIYRDKLGHEHECTRYEASQKQRQQETVLRRLKDRRNAFEQLGDTDSVKLFEEQIRANTRYYKALSNDFGLKPRLDKARVVKPHVQKEAPKVEKFIEDNRIKIVDRASAYKSLVEESKFDSVAPNFDKLDEKLVIRNAEQLRNLEEKFGVVELSQGTIRADEDADGVFAYVRSGITRPLTQSMNACPKYFRDYDFLVSESKKLAKSGYFMPCAEENFDIYTLTHEYGHMIQNYLKQLDFKAHGWNENDVGAFVNLKGRSQATTFKWYQKRINDVRHDNIEEIKAIAREEDANFSYVDNLSRYGKSSEGEAFAEIFANSQCGNPNILGRAMLKFLERKGLIKK